MSVNKNLTRVVAGNKKMISEPEVLSEVYLILVFPISFYFQTKIMFPERGLCFQSNSCFSNITLFPILFLCFHNVISYPQLIFNFHFVCYIHYWSPNSIHVSNLDGSKKPLRTWLAVMFYYWNS